jgi:hypothetical protein
MKAATTRRPWRPACASTLPMKWTAAPPGGMQRRSDSGLNAFMGIGDDQLDATQARQASLCKNSVQKGLGLRWSGIHAKHFAAAVAVDADRDDHRNRHDAPALAHLHVGGVDPQIGPVAFDRAAQERFHLLVDLDAATAGAITAQLGSLMGQQAAEVLQSAVANAATTLLQLLDS